MPPTFATTLLVQQAAALDRNRRGRGENSTSRPSTEVRSLLGALTAAGEPLKEGHEAAKALAGAI